MEKLSKLSRISLRRVLFVSMLIIGLSTFPTMSVNATTISYDPPTYSALTPHDSIYITSDSNFTDYGFPGSGTAEDPYIIDSYDITTTSDLGIYIRGTTKYFTVCNCYIDALWYGIYITNVADGTATVVNNTCRNNNSDGIGLYSSGNSTVTNNTCTNNWGGIELGTSGNSTVVKNTCNNNNCGIRLDVSGNSTVANNTCSNNELGISLYYSYSCFVTYNILQENGEYGVYSSYGSENNTIHHNNLVDNTPGGTSQAYDAGIDNFWYDSATQEGNYWSDWSGTGNYSIDGSAGSVDLYPLNEPVEHSTVISTTVISTTDETQIYFTFTLLIVVIPLLLMKLFSRKRLKWNN